MVGGFIVAVPILAFTSNEALTAPSAFIWTIFTCSPFPYQCFSRKQQSVLHLGPFFA
jgi:hypothetical protein